MAGNESDLPFGDAFSPAQPDTETGEYTKLAAVLEMVGEHEGEEAEFKSAVAERFFESSRNPEERARLVVLGLKNQGYQLVTDDFYFTDLGERLYDLTDALRAAGVTVSDIRTVQPDLEEVFLERTGTGLGGASP